MYALVQNVKIFYLEENKKLSIIFNPFALEIYTLPSFLKYSIKNKITSY